MSESFHTSADIDELSISQTLLNCGADIRAKTAVINSCEFSIECENVDGFIEYDISLSLRATDEAQFNNMFDELVESS